MTRLVKQFLMLYEFLKKLRFVKQIQSVIPMRFVNLFGTLMLFVILRLSGRLKVYLFQNESVISWSKRIVMQLM